MNEPSIEVLTAMRRWNGTQWRTFVDMCDNKRANLAYLDDLMASTDVIPDINMSSVNWVVDRRRKRMAIRLLLVGGYPTIFSDKVRNHTIAAFHAAEGAA